MKDILLLHGALGSKEQFSDLNHRLSEHFNVFTFSFNGHGGRDLPDEPFSIDMFADEIITFVKANDLKQADIFGYSMGGYAALYAASKHPGLFGKIFTLATKFDWSPEIADREIKMLDTGKIKQKVPKFAEELAARHGPDKWENVLKKTAEMMTELGNNNVLTAELMKNIHNEILVGIGDSDKMVTLEETITAFRSLPNAGLTVLPRTPHPLEQVDLNRLLIEFNGFFG